MLLPDVDRIIHFDLDALCLADLAELFDTALQGMALAAAAEPQPRYVGGYDTIRRAVGRMRREGNPEVARDYMNRIHSRHPFDFAIFNAGIMLLDLDKMRADDFCGNYLGREALMGFVVNATHSGTFPCGRPGLRLYLLI